MSLYNQGNHSGSKIVLGRMPLDLFSVVWLSCIAFLSAGTQAYGCNGLTTQKLVSLSLYTLAYQ